ncbi:HD domain-containing protein [Craterilacuibacter sp. RT1T]|uniref:HD domain-containing protein n=1 Tax=Craterilacuibacter sp. RT1T TaxID=2942211 RepID=UPI0020BEB8F6|nr:HD domain-containing protein [Craterilacuibacter sp. RT1T]MCL6264477.1 HD domain-containing protein [Craterilacuibacter sp. RT1T]
MPTSQLDQQFAFLCEIDQLKNVIRQSPLLDQSRKENSAEHSWHLAMYALLLKDYAEEEVDISRVIQMLLIHDIVEVDVGDMPIHQTSSGGSQEVLEDVAAIRLFGMIPGMQGTELLALWREFEQSISADAKFAKALDRVQPLLINIRTDGGTWTENGVTLEQVLERYGPTTKRGAPALWERCEQWVQQHFAAREP